MNESIFSQSGVESIRAEYAEALPAWTKTRDCVELNVKKKKQVYLPYPSTIEEDENIASKRYKDFIFRSMFVGYTKRTHDGLVGASFRVMPNYENLPRQMDSWFNDVTGTGLDLNQLAKACASETMITGRSGLYVSYPATSGEESAEETSGLLPTISLYMAEDIINWNDDNTLIVLKESYDTSDNEFTCECETQYRVLRLREEGATSQIYRDKSMTEEVLLRDASGQTFDTIPFEWVGSQNNDNEIDDSLLLAIADLNLGHYNNSADLEESSHIHGQATVYVTSSMSGQEFKQANPNGVNIGAYAGHFLGDSGSIGIAQAEPNQLADKLMERKEQQMLQIGAKLIEKSSNETAEAVRIQAASETANLSSLVYNVSKAIENSVKWAAKYLGYDAESFTYEISQEFYPSSLDAQAVMAAIQLFDRAVIAQEDLLDVGKKAGLINRDKEEIQSDVQTDNILGQLNVTTTTN